MRIAVDSSVLLDVLGADPEFGELSREALRGAYDRGALAACNVVWSEVCAHALHQADALLCGDRGFFGRDFEDLDLIDPTAA